MTTPPGLIIDGLSVRADRTHGGILPDQPFGGLKSSGLGLESGRWGYESFTDLRVRHFPAPIA